MYKHKKSKTAFRGRIMSQGLSDKPDKWLGKHFNFFKGLLQMTVIGI